MSSADTLYEEIGGREAVEAVVSDFYDRVLVDPELEHYFEDTDTEKLYAHQVAFVSSVAGGPVEYEGRDMEAAHEGLGITGAAFERVAEHLEAALRANDVADENVAAILDAFASYEDDVVEATA